MDEVGRRLGGGGLLVIGLLIFGLFVAYNAGRAQALKQEEFLILSGSPEAVVLRQYEDNLILAPFDRDTRKVEKSFFIVKASDESRPLFTLEKVGPLRSTD